MRKDMKRFAILALAGLALLTIAEYVQAAEYSTDNFAASHSSAAFARQVAEQAEASRRQVAIDWLGKELPRWTQPCPITVRDAKGTGGATTFSFDRGQVFGWRMIVQGSREGILNDAIPHEVTHTVMASHFRRKLPRWADEGMATLSETPAEQHRQWPHLRQTWNTRPIPFHQLLQMREYPKDSDGVLSLYARGHYLTRMLVERRGRKTFLAFLENSMALGWRPSIFAYYGYESIAALEQDWRAWVETAGPESTVVLQAGTKTSLYAFGYKSCEHCMRWQADERAGKFSMYAVTYFDVETPEGAAKYRELTAAIRKANGTVEPGFPAFHVAGRAVIHAGYARQSGARRFLDWGRETFRLPVTIFDAVTNPNDRGVSPPPAGLESEQPEKFEREQPAVEPTPENVEIGQDATPAAKTKSDANESSDKPETAVGGESGDDGKEERPSMIWAILAGLATAVVEAIRNKVLRGPK